MMHTPDEVILQRSLQQLDTMFGTAVSPTPATAAFVRGEVFNWAKEPFVRAAYTYPRVRVGVSLVRLHPQPLIERSYSCVVGRA